MRYLLILAVLLVSLCTGLPQIPFFGSGDTTIERAGLVTIDEESPDVFLSLEVVPNELKSGRDVSAIFNLVNKNAYDLKNVKVNVYDLCGIFSGDSVKDIAEIKGNRSAQWQWKWSSQKVDMDRNCDIKFRMTYEATNILYQDIAVLPKGEYEQREMSGTLSSIPVQSSSTPSPLSIALSFSDQHPFIANEKYYMYIDYRNSGGGIIEIKQNDIAISAPGNINNFQCSGYALSGTDYKNTEDLKFVGNRASTTSCNFMTSTPQAMDIKSLYITSHYKYMLDNSIIIKVKRA